MKTEKVQKILATTGLGSRRKLEEFIAAGRVSIDGKIAKLGDRATSKAKICVDGRKINLDAVSNNSTKVLIYNKPIGEICTRSDEQGRKTVFKTLPQLDTGRWISIGRIDINSQGLLLFTNNGELAHRLMHPSTEIEREYLVRVHGKVNDADLNELQQGFELDDGFANFKAIHRTRRVEIDKLNQWYRVTVTEGRNRLVRRLWNAKGFAVNRLIRIRFHSIILPRSLRLGSFIELEAANVKMLLEFIGINSK